MIWYKKNYNADNFVLIEVEKPLKNTDGLEEITEVEYNFFMKMLEEGANEK